MEPIDDHERQLQEQEFEEWLETYERKYENQPGNREDRAGAFESAKIDPFCSEGRKESALQKHLRRFAFGDRCNQGALNNAGIVFLQTPSPSEDGTLALTTRLIHESGEWIEDTATCPLPKRDPQGFGSAMTYLRRYSLAAITGLYQDDDDGNAASGVGEKKPIRQYMGDEEFTEMTEEINNSSVIASKKLIRATWDVLNDEQRAYLKEAFPHIFKKEAA